MKVKFLNVIFFIIILTGANLATWYFFSSESEQRLLEIAQESNEQTVATTTASLNAQLETIAIDARSTLNRIFTGQKQKMRTRVEQERSELSENSGIQAITLFKKDVTAQNGWRAQFRLLNEVLDNNPAADQMWVEIDHQTASGLETAEQGKIEVLSFETSTRSRGLTVYAPYGPIGKGQNHLVLGIMIKPTVLKVHPQNKTEIFLVDRHGRYLVNVGKTKKNAYRTFEKLEHLPILQLAKHNRQVNGSMVYSPNPGQEEILGSYQLLGYSGATLISQMETIKVSEQIHNLDKRLLLICFVITMVATAIFILGSIPPSRSIRHQRLKRRHS